MTRPFLPLPLCACLLFVGGPSFAENPGPEGAADVVDVSATQTLGWIESFRLMPGRALLKAKLDSGAKSSALHAENIEYFEQDNRQMVRFTVLEDHRDPESERFIYERPLVREVSIKLRRTEQRDARPAVRLEFCMAGKRRETLFTLTDRGNFNYPVLLGRDFLKHGIVVDSSATFTQRTRCPR